MSGNDKSYVSVGDGPGPDSVSIKWGAVLLTIGSTLVTFGFLAVTTVLETLVNLHIWAVSTVGDAEAQYLETYLTDSASIWSASLDAAAGALSMFGVFAPWVAAIEIVVLVAIFVTVWSVAVG